MIKCLYANINSYNNKKELIRHYIENNSIQCMMMVETKTKLKHNVKYKNWDTIIKHGNILNENTRGGSLVQAEKFISIGKSNPPHLNNPWNEVLHFTIPFKAERIHIFLVYIHHSSQYIEENLLVKASQYKYSMIIGDLNVNNRRKKQLKNFTSNSDFVEICTPPTFLMENNKGTTPDRFLCTKNILQNIKNVQLTPDLGSNHLAIEFDLDLESNPLIYPTETRYDYSKCHIGKVNAEMCQLLKSGLPITTNYITSFTQNLSEIIKKHSPKIQVKYYSQKIPAYILRLIKVKKQMYREITINEG
ncbi:uncharacterized protein LOC123306273 [Coccinella septempunctata]|uniref:uncharacterized protein LOC123306273 n=1 Tax=Coccinella septempunctata TaxID=41139 RepID=UPI001D07087B|nr:uncharacterized protein LOC123306273 [Coccinella septempunctata]